MSSRWFLESLFRTVHLAQINYHTRLPHSCNVHEHADKHWKPQYPQLVKNAWSTVSAKSLTLKVEPLTSMFTTKEQHLRLNFFRSIYSNKIIENNQFKFFESNFRWKSFFIGFIEAGPRNVQFLLLECRAVSKKSPRWMFFKHIF